MAGRTNPSKLKIKFFLLLEVKKLGALQGEIGRRFRISDN